MRLSGWQEKSCLALKVAVDSRMYGDPAKFVKLPCETADKDQKRKEVERKKNKRKIRAAMKRGVHGK